MRRADRLFQIVQILRSGRLTTAATLAEQLEVSERTIYRDIADLQGSGVPVDGEAGLGYLMREGYDLPPIMFSKQEVEALIVGARLVSAWGGARMALDAEAALSKIENVLPDDMKDQASRTSVFAFDFLASNEIKIRFDQVNAAITNSKVLAIEYSDMHETGTTRHIQPLALHYWGKVWTVASWCRLRDSFRSFRLDRMGSVSETGETFTSKKGQTLRDYLELMSREH